MSDIDAAAARIAGVGDLQQFAIQILPRGKREDVRAIIDGCTLIRQAMLSPALALGCCSGGTQVAQRLPPILEDVLTRRAVPRQVVQSFLDACAADAATTRYATWSALRRHCEGVGGNVAVMVASVLGVTHSDALPRAVAVGAAMRLTGILNDLGRDLAAGRVYLPMEDLVSHRVREREILERSVADERVERIVKANVDRARELLRAGGEALPWVAPDGSRAVAGFIIALTAARLDEIERAGAQVLHKPPTMSGLRVLRRLGDAWRLAHRDADEPHVARTPRA